MTDEEGEATGDDAAALDGGISAASGNSSRPLAVAEDDDPVPVPSPIVAFTFLLDLIGTAPPVGSAGGADEASEGRGVTSSKF